MDEDQTKTRKLRHWAHDYFWDKRPGCGHYRFCKVCYPIEENCPSVEDVAKAVSEDKRPSSIFKGCCCNDGSPSAMGNHMINHRSSLPEGHRTSRKSDSSSGRGKVSTELMEDWSQEIVLRELQPVRLIGSEGMKNVLKGRVDGLGSVSTLQSSVHQQISDIKEDVRELVQQGVKDGARFCIQADSWKPKMRRVKHYTAVILTWISATWQFMEACIAVIVMGSTRAGEDYEATFLQAIHEAGLTDSAASQAPETLFCALSDHEGAIRRGCGKLGQEVASVGCGCHALQLPVQHALPALRTRRYRRDEDEEGQPEEKDSGSSSSDSDSSSSDSSPERPKLAVPAKRKLVNPELVKIQKQREQVTSGMEPLVKKVRRLIRFYINHEELYNTLEAQAKEANLPFCCFRTETATRWHSALDSWISVLANIQALQVHHGRHGASLPKLPALLSESEQRELLHYCCVLTPLRKATKLLEGAGAKALCSIYLPVWAAVVGQLRSENLPVPAELRDRHGAVVLAARLVTTAKHLRIWLIEDLHRTQEKHLLGTTGHGVLLMASFLDPRFKQHQRYAPAEHVADARMHIVKCAVQAATSRPELVKARANRQAACDLDPNNRPLIALAEPVPELEHARGRGRARGGRGAPRGRGAARGAANIPGPQFALPKAQPVKRSLKRVLSADELLFGDAGQVAEEVAAADIDVEEECRRQLSRYEALPAITDVQLDVLSWWRENAWQFPLISIVASWVFAVPASTASLERLFSAAGRAITRRRPRLQAKNAAELIFGHCNVVRGINGRKASDRRKQAKE